MNRAVDWLVRGAFAALVCMVFYFAQEAGVQRQRADRAERRLEVAVSRARLAQSAETLAAIERRLDELAALEGHP